MPEPVARRAFLSVLAAAPLVPELAPAPAPGMPPAAAVAPPRTARIKLSCNLYSFNAPLRSGEMTLEQAIDACAELGFDAVDPTGYYFPGHPAPPSDAYLHAIKLRAFRNGLDVSGTGVRNDFTVPEAASRDADVAHVGRWAAVAATLGAPVLRVFDGRAEAKGTSREEMTGWVVEAFRACAAHGERHGIVIAYQNHDELLKTADEILAVRARVASEWFGLNVDIGSLRTGDPYEEVARLAPHACTWQIKERLYRKGREERTDLRRVFAILRQAGYRGYAPLETLGPGDPREKVRRFLDEARAALA
ncbi:MAG TPA: sugar phosphate isomerase/epimerase family protein [Vicinamibacteria bacterium]|nr:sugar phosphate isomerase/epimerase family protein [Vicinamibacteria bacterium]